MDHQELNCRSCGHASLEPVLEFGETALADRILDASEAGQPQLRFSLTLVYCANCSLLQIAETVDPTVLFDEHYRYFSSSIPSLVQHAKQLADQFIHRLRLTDQSLVVELASNDGYLLQHFSERGILLSLIHI